MKGISIIICCYNSAYRLPETLKYIALQKVPMHISCEVIIVDNASKDKTAEVAKQEWTKHTSKIPFNIVTQPLPGLSNAREKGFETAKYDFLLFCDDDNWLCEDYIRTAYEVMSDHPTIGALGGIGTPVCEIEPPDWFQRYAGPYATGKQGEKSGEALITKHIYGAGAIYRKQAINDLKTNNFTFSLTGRNGNKLSNGEDHELCYAMFLAGYKIWYDERLQFKHFIPKERLTWQYIKGTSKGTFESSAILSAYKVYIEAKNEKLAFKQTWYWVMLMKILFFLKRDALYLFKYILLESKSTEKTFAVTHSLQSIIVFYRNRQQFSHTLKTIRRSKWNTLY